MHRFKHLAVFAVPIAACTNNSMARSAADTNPSCATRDDRKVLLPSVSNDSSPY